MIEGVLKRYREGRGKKGKPRQFETRKMKKNKKRNGLKNKEIVIVINKIVMIEGVLKEYREGRGKEGKLQKI